MLKKQPHRHRKKKKKQCMVTKGEKGGSLGLADIRHYI